MQASASSSTQLSILLKYCLYLYSFGLLCRLFSYGRSRNSWNRQGIPLLTRTTANKKDILEAGDWQAKNTSWEEILKVSNFMNAKEGTANDRIG